MKNIKEMIVNGLGNKTSPSIFVLCSAVFKSTRSVSLSIDELLVNYEKLKGVPFKDSKYDSRDDSVFVIEVWQYVNNEYICLIPTITSNNIDSIRETYNI